VRLQHRIHRRPQREIGAGHDPLGHARARRDLARARGGRLPLDELGLPHGAQRLRATGPVAGAALDKDRGDHPVPARQIGEQVRQQVPVARPLPEVMVRIDDGQVRLEGILGHLGEPGGQTLRRAIGHGGTSCAELG